MTTLLAGASLLNCFSHVGLVAFGLGWHEALQPEGAVSDLKWSCSSAFTAQQRLRH